MAKPTKKNLELWFLTGILILAVVLIFFLAFTRPQKKVISPLSPRQTETISATPTETIPGSENFEEVISQLNTSQKLIAYLNENFTLEPKESNVALSPREFFEKKKGNSWDFAVFASYVLWYNKYEASIIRYKYDGDKINAVVVFRDQDLPKTMIFTPEEVKAYPHGWSFAEMFQKEEERLNTKIKEYTLSYWTDKGELWEEEWFKR